MSFVYLNNESFGHRPEKNNKRFLKWGGGIVAGLVALGISSAIATDRLKITDPNKYSYTQDDYKVWQKRVFGKAFFLSADPFTDADKLNSEGHRVVRTSQSYVPNAHLQPADKIIMTIKLTAKVMDCPEDATELIPQSISPGNSLPNSSTSLTPDTVRICLNYGKLAVSGDNFIVPLALIDKDGKESKISEPARSPKCEGWATKYAGIVNRDILEEALSSGMQFQPSDQYPVIIRMSSEQRQPCDMDSVDQRLHQK